MLCVHARTALRTRLSRYIAGHGGGSRQAFLGSYAGSSLGYPCPDGSHFQLLSFKAEPQEVWTDYGAVPNSQAVWLASGAEGRGRWTATNGLRYLLSSDNHLLVSRKEADDRCCPYAPMLQVNLGAFSNVLCIYTKPLISPTTCASEGRYGERLSPHTDTAASWQLPDPQLLLKTPALTEALPSEDADPGITQPTARDRDQTLETRLSGRETWLHHIAAAPSWARLSALGASAGSSSNIRLLFTFSFSHEAQTEHGCEHSENCMGLDTHEEDY